MITTASPIRSLSQATLACFMFCLLSFLPFSLRAEWVVDGDTVYFTDHVAYTSDGLDYAGTVSLRMDNVTVSGQFKIVTTILDVTPEPGWTAVIKKAGGVNGVVEIVFQSATCQSKFSFLYKPGLTRIDYGLMRCR
ncbi:MAG: hypothetical protein JNN07_15880 [Verrucomicrobiales bacterium]|nr:hypothetical protein [Verrucomicrobiales bacterium]